jgi:hypothetical protein
MYKMLKKMASLSRAVTYSGRVISKKWAFFFYTNDLRRMPTPLYSHHKAQYLET